MRSPLAIRAAGLFALLCVASSGCGDTPAPTAPAATGPSAGLLSSVLQVSLLQRLLPLGQNYSASATIGTAGGTIRIREAGMTITFPAGAVSAPVTVRATALAGSNVAYTFEPHGLVFQKDPTIVQDLGVTEVVRQLLSPPTLAGGYFTDESQITGSTANVVETRAATVDLLRLQMSFTVHHFSGYAATSKSKYISSSNDRTASPGKVR
ncbi:MAG TPA: hypothetical protein VF541_05385 [Longimicrobium sp.]|jgi:hypothetical protein